MRKCFSSCFKDNEGADSSLTVDIFQKHSQLRGDWHTASNIQMGTFKGTIRPDGTTISFKLRSNGKKCKVTVDASLISADQITGTYSTKSCAGVTSGTVSLTLAGPA